MRAQASFVFLLVMVVGLCARGDDKAEKPKEKEGAATVEVTYALDVKGSIAKRLYLYEHFRKDSSLATGKPLPNRVYVRFIPEMDEWVFVKSDADGKFADPPEVLVTGTILPGYYLGTGSDSRLRFDAGAKWTPTSDPELHRVIVLAKPPKLRTVEFFAEEKFKLETVSGEKASVRAFYPEPMR